MYELGKHWGTPRWGEERDALLTELDRADVLVAYNGHQFDLPFLHEELVVDDAVMLRWQLKLFDPLSLTSSCYSRRIKLKYMLELNGLEEKSADGMEVTLGCRTVPPLPSCVHSHP